MCFECAEPALAHRSAARQAAEQHVGGAGPSTHVDPQGGAAEPATLGRGATQRRSPQRYDPGDVRVQKAAGRAQKRAMDEARKKAVTRELRAIVGVPGVTPLLTRVSATEARAHADKLRGADRGLMA